MKQTKMQLQFKEHMGRPIIAILFPEFADIMNEFKIKIHTHYTWVYLTAIRPAIYYGIDDRTKKERKQYSRPDSRELIEEKYTIEVGLDNHSQYPHKLSGKISRQYMEDNFNVIKFYVWNFHYSYGANITFTEEQISNVWEYLKTQGIGLPSHDEFWDNYWRD